MIVSARKIQIENPPSRRIFWSPRFSRNEARRILFHVKKGLEMVAPYDKLTIRRLRQIIRKLEVAIW